MRGYTDETLNFCLDDGAALLDGPASRSDARKCGWACRNIGSYETVP